MPKFQRAVLVGAVLFSALVLAHPAFAAEYMEEPQFPVGRYDGSAAGGDADPIAVTVYLNGTLLEDGKLSHDPQMSVRASGLPAVISVEPKNLFWDGNERCWLFEVSVNKYGLKGSGSGQIVPNGGKVTIFGEGDGSYKKNSGSGFGSADLVDRGQMSEGAQIGEALTSFLGGPPTGAVKPPRRYKPVPVEEKPDPTEKSLRREIKKMVKALVGDKPLGPAAFMIWLLVAYVILLALGLI